MQHRRVQSEALALGLRAGDLFIAFQFQTLSIIKDALATCGNVFPKRAKLGLVLGHGRIGAVDLGPLADGQGMFALLPLSVAQIDMLQSEHGIYMAHSGRINIAGLAEEQVDRFVDALTAVQHKNAA